MAMQEIKFTETKLKKLPTPTDKPKWYKAGGQPGLRACKFPSGTLAFYCQHKEHTKSIGKNINAAEAKSNFIAMLARIDGGEFDEPVVATELVTVGQARETKLEFDAPKSKTGRAAYEDDFKKTFADWLDVPIVNLKKSHVIKRHKEITETRGPVAANHAIVALKAAINFAFKFYEEDEIGGNIRNPAAGVKLNKPRKHTPAWTAKSDFPRLWQGLNQLPNVELADWIRFIALTGMRPGTDEKSESGALWMKWEFIDFDRHLICVPGAFTKNDERLMIPMVPQVEKILLRQRDRLQAKYQGVDLTWVWPQNGRPHKVPVNPSATINMLRGIIGFHFRPHELRHHWSEIAKRTLNTETRKALGGWKMKNVDEEYGWDDPEELRPDAEKLVAKLMRRAEPIDDVVVQMRA